jgi:hypothetical protein
MEAEEQLKYSKVPPQLRPHVFKKGQSGNPGGRPKGAVSLKEYAKRMLQQMDEKEAMEYLHGIDKKVIWEMAEGKPDTQTDITSKGEKIVFSLSEEIASKNEINTETGGDSEGHD